MQPSLSYFNKVGKGDYVYYRLRDSEYDLDYIHTLQFDLKTFIGDADLYVETQDQILRPNTTNHSHASRSIG